jgi:hypothetical protein
MPPHTLCTSRNGREYLRAVTSRGAARDRETRRRRESVGTDSRVLRLETPVGASLEASGANFFSLGESFDVGVNARAKTRARGAALARSRRNNAQRDVTKTRISSAFLHRVEFFAFDRAAEKLFGARFAGHRFAFAPRRRGAALTHKIKWSHCYFFPAVVIGWQCTSIRDCTVCRHPLMARRAAMAKKRKTKAATKKTAKKTTKRKKKK